MCRRTAAGGTTAQPTQGLSTPVNSRSNRTDVQAGLLAPWTSFEQLERRTPEYVALRNAHVLEAERGERLDQDEHAGHDRRRPVGMQAAHLPALRQRHGGE